MSTRSWFRGVFAANRCQANSQPHRVELYLCRLEDRRTLNADPGLAAAAPADSNGMNSRSDTADPQAEEATVVETHSARSEQSSYDPAADDSSSQTTASSAGQPQSSASDSSAASEQNSGTASAGASAGSSGNAGPGGTDRPGTVNESDQTQVSSTSSENRSGTGEPTLTAASDNDRSNSDPDRSDTRLAAEAADRKAVGDGDRDHEKREDLVDDEEVGGRRDEDTELIAFSTQQESETPADEQQASSGESEQQVTSEMTAGTGSESGAAGAEYEPPPAAANSDPAGEATVSSDEVFAAIGRHQAPVLPALRAGRQIAGTLPMTSGALLMGTVGKPLARTSQTLADLDSGVRAPAPPRATGDRDRRRKGKTNPHRRLVLPETEIESMALKEQDGRFDDGSLARPHEPSSTSRLGVTSACAASGVVAGATWLYFRRCRRALQSAPSNHSRPITFEGTTLTDDV